MVEDARRAIISPMSLPDSATPHDPAPSRLARAQSRLTGLGGIALLLGLAIAFAVAFLFVLQSRQTTPNPQTVAAPSSETASLRTRIATDEARLAVLEKAGSHDVAALSARIGKLETAPDTQLGARLDGLDIRLSALERNALSSDLPQRIAALTREQAALEARIAKLERSNPSQVMRHAAAELALANFVRASGTSDAFAVELQAFAVLVPDAPEVRELAPIARKGAPARSELVARYSDMAAAALAAENSTRAKNWLGRLWRNIGNVIIVRRVGYSRGGDSESILARGGAKLSRGDLGGAIAEMRSLRGAARIAAQPWLVDAQARYVIERDSATLANRMAKLLATP